MNNGVSLSIRPLSAILPKAFVYPFLVFVTLFSLNGCGGGAQKAEGLGPLSEFVFTGTVEGWSGTMEEGVYWLQNQAGNAGDIRYFYTPPSSDHAGKRSAQIDVKTAEMHADARAGLLYGYRESPRFYYMILCGSSGVIDIYKRDGNDFQLSQSSSISSSESVRIEVKESGRKLTVMANGKTISTLENDYIGTGSLGIAAFGLGKFGFTNYEQSPAEGNAVANREQPNAKSSKVSEKSLAEASPSRKLPMLEFKDPSNGMVQHRSPFPKGWRYDDNPNDQLALTGPNGVQIFQTDSGRFIYSNDSFALQSARMAGGQISPVIPLGQYLQQQFGPYMQQRGYRMINQYPMPKIIDVWELIAAGMPQGLSRKHFDAVGVDWESNDGTRAFTLLVQNIMEQDKYVSWSVSASELYASKSEYEKAKDDYVYASENLEIDAHWQIAKNNELLGQLRANKQMWDERTKQSQIQHVGRMNAILARGQASSSVAKINSDILDISHAGYLKRSDMVSAGQAKTINMIGEQSVITSANTGEMYKVDSGYRNYWVNGEGQYFPTDNTLYDPRTDSSINNQQWERFEVVE